jgi:hypothetical protein
MAVKSIWNLVKSLLTLYFKVLFMNEQNPSKNTLQDIQDIRRIMERSSRFISLSGLSGIAAGICALAGAWIGNDLLSTYYNHFGEVENYEGPEFNKLKIKLLILAVAVLTVSLLTAYYFTWRRARYNHMPLWDLTSKKLLWNMLIPLAAGGLFILAMLQYNDWRFIAPACLLFYGLALVNGSKYTLSDIRYLGYIEIILGLINTQFIGYGLYFWALGFGAFHIIYGLIMWVKYERNN